MAEEPEAAVIPLIEERPVVGTREVETGHVRVHIEVEHRDETVAHQLVREEVQIERVPINVELDEIPIVRVEGATTIIPILEEKLVVEKRIMLVEEVRLHRRKVSDTQEVPVTLKSERAVIERDTADRLKSRELASDSREAGK